jgi:hypothetical protein
MAALLRQEHEKTRRVCGDDSLEAGMMGSGRAEPRGPHFNRLGLLGGCDRGVAMVMGFDGEARHHERLAQSAHAFKENGDTSGGTVC